MAAIARPRKIWLDDVAPLAFGAALAMVPLAVGIHQSLELKAMRRAWEVKGPPCAQVERPGPWVGDGRAPRTIRYGPYEFTRWSGAVDCADIPEPGLFAHGTYRVCQFNNPGAVEVSTGVERVLFQPPLGKRATVTVRRGHASCVAAGLFNY